MESERLTVLVADDSRVILKAFSRIMDEHYDLVEVADGEKAWEEIQSNDSICAVFSDWEMPVMDGVELARNIRNSKNPRIKATPVIMVTSKNNDDATKQLAYEAGATDFIAKPFDATELLARAKSYVKRIDAAGEAETDKAVLNPQSRMGNTQYFQQQGIQMVSFANRHNMPLAVMLITIDRAADLAKKFKANEQQLNDFGLEVGAYISEKLRKDDSLARLGKTVFGVLLSSSDMSRAQKFAARLQEQVQAENIKLNGQKISATLSIGIEVTEPSRHRELPGMLKTARERLIQAAKSGNGIRPLPRSHSGLQKLDSLDKVLTLITNKSGDSIDYVYLGKRLLPLLVAMDKAHGTDLANQALPIIKGQKPRIG